MAVSRGAIRDLLVPGLAEVEGKYPQIPRQYTEVFEVGYSRLALERVAEMRYTGLAALKQEGSATIFDNAPGERFVYNILMQSFGLGTALTREMLDDNLYKDHFGPMSMGLAESFAQTEEIMHATVLNTGIQSGANTIQATVVGDGQPLFSTVHPIDNGVYANRPSPDLEFNETSLEYAIQQIRVFPDQAGLRMFARSRKLVVPIALEFAAERVCKAELRPGTSDNDIMAILSSGALADPKKYQVMDFLTSPTAWFVLSTIPGLISYVRTPFELDMQVDPVTGNLMIIGFQRWGQAWRNPRSCWASFPS